MKKTSIYALCVSLMTIAIIFAEPEKNKNKDPFDDLDEKVINEANNELHKLDNDVKNLDPKVIMETFDEISASMHNAAERINDLNNINAINSQDESKEKIDKLYETIVKEQSNGKELIQKLLDISKKEQGNAVEGIEKLIKIAKQISNAQSLSQNNQTQQKEKNKKKPKKEKNNSENSPNPAKQPYKTEEKKKEELNNKNWGDKTDRWGMLPDKVRDELKQANSLEFPEKYRDDVEDYSKALNEDQK